MDTEAETVTEELDLIEGEPEVAEPEAEEEQDAPVVVTLGDEPADDDAEPMELPDDAPKWARRTREVAMQRWRENRDLKRKLAELEAKTAPVEEEPEIGAKPNLLDDDIDGDEEIYEQRLLAWYEDKRRSDAKKEAKRREAEQAQEQWQAKLTGYEEGKKRLRVPDFEEAEDLVQSVFDQTQQGIIVHGARDAAVLAYAIGKNPEKAKELAAIKDPIAFAFAVSKLEEQVKVTTRKPTVKPEGVLTSTARGSSAMDNHLERLRAEAEKTRDYTKVMAYKKQLRAK